MPSSYPSTQPKPQVSPPSPASFRTRLIGGVVLLNAFVFTLVGLSSHQSHRQYQERAETTTQNLTQTLENEIARDIEIVDLALFAVMDEYKRQRAGGGIDGKMFNAYIERIRSRLPEIDALRIADAQGLLVYGKDVIPGAKTSLADRPHFIRPRDDPQAGLVISKPLVSRANQKRVVVLARRINQSDGSFGGIAFVAITLEHLVTTFAALNVGPHGAVALRDGDLGVVARHPEPQGAGSSVGNDKVVPEFREMVAAGNATGTFTITAGFDNIERTYSYRKIGPHSLYVNVGLATEDYLAEWRHEATQQVALAGLFALITVLAAWLICLVWKRQADSVTALARQEVKLRTLADSGQALIWTAGTDKLCDYFNQVWLKFTGRSMEQELGNGWAEGVHPDDIERCVDVYMSSFERHDKFSMDYRLRRYDGEYRWIQDDGCPRYNSDGEFIGYIGYCLDITERKQTEAALSESEQRFRSFVENLNDVLFALTPRGIFSYVSPQWKEAFGYELSDALGQSFVTFVHPDDVPGCFAFLQRVMETGVKQSGIEYRVRRKDGTYRWYTANGSRFSNPDGTLTLVGIGRDITERKQTEAELQQHRNHLEEQVLARTAELVRAKIAAEAANTAKSAFLANMSHEIRTPMNGIVGMANILRREGVSPKQAQRLDTIDKSARHLLAIINDILDISKIEAGKFTLEQAPVALGSLLANVSSILAERAKAKGIHLLIESGSLPPNLVGDPTRLQQALLNYASNAVKFTETGGVTLRTLMQEETAEAVMVRFEVTDTGIGISPAAMSRLFSAFEQADNSMTRKYGGTGLGLAITRRLAELMGGEVGADSTPGVGSTFWFTARLKKSAEAPVKQPATDVDAETLIRQRYHGRRVLVVDDEPINREIAQMQLEAVGLVVDTAEDGAEAVTLAQEMVYAAIVMDMQMPKVNGLEATRQIRELPGYRRTPIIAMTANAFAEDKARCFAAGMNEFLVKPFDPDMLFATLLRSLSQPGV